MSSETGSLAGRFARLLKNSDLILTFGLFGVVGILILPVTPLVLDMLLALSIALSLLILLVIVYVRDPSEFSVFPTVLLTLTLFRLGLNVASTRLILLDGYAGNVIDAFGNFVVRGNFVVGLVVFLILVVINFVVITKGAGRIAEVTARFTLDAMPGKQMSIDAELNAGVIDELEAGRRREKIQREADFYGAMDGASKFVRGDAMAGILITLINIVGGISIGVFQKDLALVESLHRYTLLSIGDGLVSQIPSLIVSVAAGLLITRSSDDVDMGEHLGNQLLQFPRAIAVVGVMLLIFAILPGMPTVPFMILGLGAFGVAHMVKKSGFAKRRDRFEKALEGSARKGLPGETASGAGESGTPAEGGAPAPAAAQGPADFQKIISVETFAVELGFGLLSLADRAQGGDLLDRITGARKTFAREVGMIVPAISVRDNLELESNEYRFLLRGKEVARGMVVPQRWMAMNVAGGKIDLKGIPAVEPVFGLDAVWIVESEKRNAEIGGFTVVDAPSVLITHLAESLRGCAHLILEREDTQKLIDLVKEKNPTLVNELLPDLASVGLVQRVLQNLLKERIPIKNLGLILETIADFATLSKSPDDLSEQARRRLGLYFVDAYEADKGLLKALTLEPRLEQALAQRVKRTQFDLGLVMDPALTQHLLSELEPRLAAMIDEGLTPLVVLSAELRLAFRRFFEPSLPRMVVLSYQELPDAVQIKSHGIICLPPGMETAPVNTQQMAAG